VFYNDSTKEYAFWVDKSTFPTYSWEDIYLCTRTLSENETLYATQAPVYLYECSAKPGSHAFEIGREQREARIRVLHAGLGLREVLGLEMKAVMERDAVVTDLLCKKLRLFRTITKITRQNLGQKVNMYTKRDGSK
jgi:hypothetical protein